jgi:hypothetical protein
LKDPVLRTVQFLGAFAKLRRATISSVMTKQIVAFCNSVNAPEQIEFYTDRLNNETSSNVAQKFVSQVRCTLAVSRRFLHSQWLNSVMFCTASFLQTRHQTTGGQSYHHTGKVNHASYWQSPYRFKPAKIIQGQLTLISHKGIQSNQQTASVKKKVSLTYSRVETFKLLAFWLTRTFQSSCHGGEFVWKSISPLLPFLSSNWFEYLEATDCQVSSEIFFSPRIGNTK